MNAVSHTPVNFLDLWKPLSIIGNGSTCDVILVEDLKSLKKKVVKLYKPSVSTSLTEAEAKLVLSLDHSRILGAYNYYSKVVVPQSDESGANSLSALVLETAPNGELLELIQIFGNFPEIIARSYFHQLIDAVEYLHEQGICHLDIKPDNILVDENYGLKLADFGVAMSIPKDCLLKGKAGTLPYHAPEIHANKSYSAYQADLFALGITLFTMVTGSMPFASAKEGYAVYNLIRAGKFDKFWAVHDGMRPSHQAPLSKSFRSLIESMLAADPAKRLTLEQIRRHAWVRDSVASDEKLTSFVKGILVKSKCVEEVVAPKTLYRENDLVMSSC